VQFERNGGFEALREIGGRKEICGRGNEKHYILRGYK
jgi:hypothetical protein